MTRRQTITFICDTCGRTSEHEVLNSGYHEQIYTMHPHPKDWHVMKREGGGDLSPLLDYCPTCKPLSSGNQP